MSVDHEHPVESILLYPNCGMCLSSGVYVFSIVLDLLTATFSINDCAKDSGKEPFTEMHCVLLSNPCEIVKNWYFERNASW